MPDASHLWFASFYNTFAAQICLEDLSYEPLHGASEIRLLELNKGHTIEPIQCTIKHVSLNDSPGKYTALSYTWGSAEKPCYIDCNGKRLSITANLYSALHKFRLTDVSVTFWIEAICINQFDIAERESQVRMMRRIYRQAEFVFIDLGDAAEGAELIPSLLSKLLTLRNHYGEDQFVPPVLFDKFDLPSVKAPDWNALALLLCRPWFRRVWIVQECALAQELLMSYGDTVFSWSDLYRALSWLNLQGRPAYITCGDVFPDGRPIAMAGFLNLVKITSIRNGIQLQKPKPLSRCLDYVRTFETSDPRDKVYGLLGLVPDVDDFGFQVIYSDTETLENVYFRLAQALVKSGYAFDVLIFAGSQFNLMGIPSWVPNWSCEQYHLPFSYFHGGENPIYYSGGVEELSATIMENSRELAVRGSLFDEILVLGETYHGSFQNEGEGTNPIKYWEARTKMLVNELPNYPTSEPIFDVYRRVLVANQDTDGNKASALYIENYEHTLRLYELYEQAKYSEQGGPPFEVDVEESTFISKQMMEYGYRMINCANERKLCVTRKGYIGLVHNNATEGDVICVFVGAMVPFVLRECGDGYTLVSDCYIHGIMEGEVIAMQDTTMQDIIIR